MEKDIIKNISIEDFKTNKNFVDYIDDDFLVANSLENIPYSNDAVRLNCFLLISCIEGCIQLDMNNKTYPDTMLGLWVNLAEELPNYLEEDNIGITTVAVPDGNGYKYIVYDGTNADEMTGFYVPEAAEARDDFSDRSYLAPVGEAQINEYNAKGYTLTQSVLW